MAVAMEVAWRAGGDQLQLGSGPKSPAVVLDAMRSSGKRAWGADTEKLMQLMMGQFSHGVQGEEKTDVVSTLDLLGTGGGGGGGGGIGGGVSVSVEGGLDCTTVVDEFLEVEPDQPLPSGWEKCLDLKTGELYFVNKSTGMRTSEDPRKYQRAAEVLMGGVIAPRTPARPAHEFLASKKSETLREENLRASTSSGSSGEDVTTPRSHPPPAMTQLLSFSTGKRLWNLQLDDRDRDRTTISLNKTATSWGTSPRAPPFPNSPSHESNLELNLNLSPSPSPLSHTQTVCTMEMVQQALKRTEKAMGKREATTVPPPLSTSSSSIAEPSWSRSSPSTSSSSTSKSGAHDIASNAPRVNCEVESSGAAPLELVMGACTRCPMFVMVNKKDPKCPRCESEVGLESFSSVAPSAKRQRVEATVLQ